MNKITSRTDISTWVANANPHGYQGELDSAHEAIVEALVDGDHPDWGTDWSDYLDAFDYASVVEGHAKSLTVRVQIDEENNAEAWWDAAHASTDMPEFARYLVVNGHSLLLTIEQAAELRTWAEKLPGWADGPEHAREALTFRDA